MTARECLLFGLEQSNTQGYPQAVDNLMQYCTLLLEKNKVMNLTGATQDTQVVSRHFLDCICAYQHIPLTGQVIDVGTGAGFPGMVLAMLHPQVSFTLLDSLQKRIAFLQECATRIGLQNVTAVHARAEEFGHRAQFDTVVSRAVADLRVLCELCLPLVKVGGLFAPMKSTASDAEIEAAQPAIAQLGGCIEQVETYQIAQSEIYQRVIHIRKVEQTPQQYPRRFARITAHPL